MSRIDPAGVARINDGVPAVTLLSDLLTFLLDHPDPQDEAALTHAVRRGFLGGKTARLSAIYGTEDPWPPYIADGLTVLEAKGLVEVLDGGWVIGPRFEPGRAFPISPGLRVRVDPVEKREAADEEARTRLSIGEMAASLEPGRPGLRPLDEKHIERLAESMREFGFLDGFGILEDQHGRILDGRHRMEAARRVGLVPRRQKAIDVKSDREAVAIAWVAGMSRPFSAADNRRLEQTLGGSPREVLGPRFAVLAALRRDHRRSTREIAREAGVSDKTAGDHRAFFVESGEVPEWNPRAEAVALKAQRPEKSNRAIAGAIGASARAVDGWLAEGAQNAEAPHSAHPDAAETTPEPATPAASGSPMPSSQPKADTGSRKTTTTTKPHWRILDDYRNDAVWLHRLLIRDVITNPAAIGELAALLQATADALGQSQIDS